MGIINSVAIAELCKGSTTDSDSVGLGSNPSSAAKKKSSEHIRGFFYLLTLTINLFHYIKKEGNAFLFYVSSFSIKVHIWLILSSLSFK